MTFAFSPARGLSLLLACFCALGTASTPIVAASPAVADRTVADRTVASRAVEERPAILAPRTTAPLYGSALDGVLGNRSRMIQLAFVGFAIGVAILMTATRKH